MRLPIFKGNLWLLVGGFCLGVSSKSPRPVRRRDRRPVPYDSAPLCESYIVFLRFDGMSHYAIRMRRPKYAKEE